MLRKALTLGMVFILALSLLLVSMITCFTYDAEAHGPFHCRHFFTGAFTTAPNDLGWPWCCVWFTH